MTTNKYKMGRQINDEVEANVEANAEVNYVANSDYSTINNEQYSPPHPPSQVFQLNKAKLYKLKYLLMSKENPTIKKKDAMLENVKYMIGDADKFTVGYSS